MVTDIAERPLSGDQRQMLQVLIKRMLAETNPEKLTMFTEQIRRIAIPRGAREQRPNAA